MHGHDGVAYDRTKARMTCTRLGTKRDTKRYLAVMLFFARRYARLDMILSPEGTLYEHVPAHDTMKQFGILNGWAFPAHHQVVLTPNGFVALDYILYPTGNSQGAWTPDPPTSDPGGSWARSAVNGPMPDV